MTDKDYMQEAINLARLGAGFTAPNPMVGAVVVKDGVIVGKGYHHKYGQAHAEVEALAMAGLQAQGATLYVTLEPCAHYGKTPPCANRVVEAGIKRVVIGSVDPNPLVAGKGIAILKAGGIQVDRSSLEDFCIDLNQDFFTFIQTKKPHITLKSAMSLDGKIATRSGQSQWITNQSARADGHVLRAKHQAMMVGVGTILSDDPSLNARATSQAVYGIDNHPIHQPDVIILDSLGRTPLGAKVFQEAGRQVLIFVSEECSMGARDALQDLGAQVIEVAAREGVLDLEEILLTLGQMGYMSILVEGGSALLASFAEEEAFDAIVTYIGNEVIGGLEATPALGGQGFACLEDTPQLTFKSAVIIDNNIKIVAERNGREGAYVHRNH